MRLAPAYVSRHQAKKHINTEKDRVSMKYHRPRGYEQMVKCHSHALKAGQQFMIDTDASPHLLVDRLQKLIRIVLPGASPCIKRMQQI